MLTNLFKGLFEYDSLGQVITIKPSEFLICVLVSIALGIAIAATHLYKGSSTKSFLFSLALLPSVVCVVIMMVNGNVGTGIAVAGTFSLVRFRSVPGSAREIGMLFLSMGSGLICGTGHLAYAVLYTVLLCGFVLIYWAVCTHLPVRVGRDRLLKITIPEDLNYTDVFAPEFETYTSKCQLVGLKTASLGSLYKLTYRLTLKDAKLEKEMIDALRMKNGNLEINMMREELNKGEQL